MNFFSRVFGNDTDAQTEVGSVKLFDLEGFPNPRRIRIVLAEKNASDQVEVVQVDVMNGQHRTPEWRAMNPDASVPFLRTESGDYLSQCTAITEYLDGKFGGPALCGVGHEERAIIHMMNRRAEAGLMDASATYFHHATDGLGPELEVYQNKDWGLHQRDVAQNTMRYLDTVLADNDFIAGDRFTVADITAIAGLDFSEYVGIEIPARLDNLAAWSQRIHDRPGCVA